MTDLESEASEDDPISDDPLSGARIVLGVTGGISAYKAVLVCRLLIEAGAHVAPIMTDAAKRFVGEVTLTALASEPVRTTVFDDDDAIAHTRLGQTADLVLVAPATARAIGSYAAGIADDLLGTTLIATRAPVVVCPAMHTEMWEHPSVQDNIALLIERGVRIVEPGVGRLAGGDSGAGRLAEPDAIVDAARAALADSQPERDLDGLRVLVSAGGTREAIDPVRFIGNRSTGRQGIALAEAAAARGAEVVLVSTAGGPSSGHIRRIDVESAAELAAAVHDEATSCDVVVMAAAVADFRPVEVAGHKIKKGDGTPEIRLERTEDVLATLGERRRTSQAPEGQTLVGFAAETRDVEAAARAKLERKNVDLIVGNDVSAPGAGFAHGTNQVVIVGRHSSVQMPLASKRVTADAVWDAILEVRGGRDPAGPDL